MKKVIPFIFIVPTIAFADGDVSVGGNNSFNNNHGSINVNATSNYSSEQIKNLERIEARSAELVRKVMEPGITKEQVKAINAESSLLPEIKELNLQNISDSSKSSMCKSKAKGLVNVMGHEVSFLYRNCESYFGS